MKFVIYARISPRGSGYDADNETSIPMQLQYCRDYAKLHGGTVVGEYVDIFASGKDTDRPQFREMIAQLDDPECPWDCILCYKLSRFSRSRRDCENLFYALTEHGKSFASVTENIDINSISGRAYVGMLQIFNQLEREQCAENVRNRMLTIAKAGGCPNGRAPLGYWRSGKKHDNIIVPDPATAPVMRELFRRFAAREPLTDILRTLPRHLGMQNAIRLLRNPVYVGKVPYAGQVFPGKHEPLVTPEVFDAVQALLPQKSPEIDVRPSRQKFPYILAGILRCSCGRFMTPASAKRGRYHYYQCTDAVHCRARVSAEKLQDAVLAVMRSFRFSRALIDGVIAGIEAERRRQMEQDEPRRRELDRLRAEAEAQRARVFALMTAGNVSAENLEYFNRQLAELTAEVRRLDEERAVLKARLDIARADVRQEVAEFLAELERMQGMFAKIPEDPDVRRTMVRTYIKKISRLDETRWEIVLNVTGERRYVWIENWYTECAPDELPAGFRFAVKIAA